MYTTKLEKKTLVALLATIQTIGNVRHFENFVQNSKKWQKTDEKV
jgi:hypothetical protein